MARTDAYVIKSKSSSVLFQFSNSNLGIVFKIKLNTTETFYYMFYIQLSTKSLWHQNVNEYMGAAVHEDMWDG